MHPDTYSPIMRVTRTKAEAKASYDKMSSFYDYFVGIFERKFADMALKQLQVAQGEKVLEAGFGTGHCLLQMAKLVGKEGKVYGIDISSGMLAVSKKRLEKAGLWDRVELINGDAIAMPYSDNTFDAVFMSFALELFDTPEISLVLKEIQRVLKSNGRIGIISMAKPERISPLVI
jgi:ubiquinone/menaquinone biosynthesis C-methylase UbiE